MAWVNITKDPVYVEEVSDGMILRYSLKSIAVVVYNYYGDIDVWNKDLVLAINEIRRMSHIDDISSLDIDYLTAFCLQHIDSIMTAELNNPVMLEWMRNQTRMQVTRNGEYDLMIEGSDYVESV